MILNMVNKDLLGSEGKELSDLELKVLACSKLPNIVGNSNYFIGDVRQCAGFSTEASYTEIVPGGHCDEDNDEIDKICKGISAFLPPLNNTDYTVIKRDTLGGYGIVSKRNVGDQVKIDEVIVKKVNNAWKAVFYSPTGKINDIISHNVNRKVSQRYGNSFGLMLEFANGRRSLPSGTGRITYHEDAFGEALNNLKNLNLVRVGSCLNNERCISLKNNGYEVYFAFNRGKPNDGIRVSDKEIRNQVKGGASMEIIAHLTGKERTGSGSENILLKGEALKSAKRKMAEAQGVSDSSFPIDPSGVMKIKNLGNWQGRTIKGMVDEIEKYEKEIAKLGYNRPNTSTIKSSEGDQSILSGNIHYTFTPPASVFDLNRKPMWELFMLNFTRLTQWWEPIVLGASGSPAKNNTPNSEIEMWHSLSQHESDKVKAGASTILGLIPNDGAIGILTRSSSDVDWVSKDVREGGKNILPDQEKGDLRVRDASLIWSQANISNCLNQNNDHPICRRQTDQPIELRFFEYEPLHVLQERAEVIPILMDRAYQLASQKIEVPEARNNNKYNSFMWKVMTQGKEAKMSLNAAKTFSRIFTGEYDKIPRNTKVFKSGQLIIDDLWKNHYDDYFTKYFGVSRKPAHIDRMGINIEGVENQSINQYREKEQAEDYGQGSIL
jgi:hypothetical protein